jgi:hypothetical protein
MRSDIADELRELRRRAYGPAADIHDDAAAFRRLQELEGAGASVRSATRGDDPEAEQGPPPADAAAAVGAAEPDDATDDARLADPADLADAASASDRPRRPRWLVIAAWAVSLLLAVLATALVSRAVIQRVQVDPQQVGATQVARLGVDPDRAIPEVFTNGTPELRGFSDFHGMEVLVSVDGGGIWYGTAGSTDECMTVTTTAVFESATDDSYSGPSYYACAANAFPAAVALKVTADLPEELRRAFPEGTALQFVYDEPSTDVVVFSSPG